MHVECVAGEMGLLPQCGKQWSEAAGLMCELLARHPPPPNTRTNTQLQPPSSGQPSLDKLSTDHPQSDIQPALDAASPQEQQQQQESSLNQQPSFRAALDGAWHALADMAAAGAIGEERLAVLCHIANAVHLAPWDGADSITSEGTTDGAPEVTGAGAEGRWYASIVAAIPYCMAHAAMLLKVGQLCSFLVQKLYRGVCES